MKHIAAYALLVLAGKDKPTAAEVEKVVKDAGATADKEKIEALVKAMEGKEFDELVKTLIVINPDTVNSVAPQFPVIVNERNRHILITIQ